MEKVATVLGLVTVGFVAGFAFGIGSYIADKHGEEICNKVGKLSKDVADATVKGIKAFQTPKGVTE